MRFVVESTSSDTYIAIENISVVEKSHHHMQRERSLLSENPNTLRTAQITPQQRQNSCLQGGPNRRGDLRGKGNRS